MNKKASSTLVILEGISKCGKTTLANSLKKSKMNGRWTIVHPHDSTSGAIIKFCWKYFRKFIPPDLLLFVYEWQHQKTLVHVKSLLDEGFCVILDRTFFTTSVYQFDKENEIANRDIIIQKLYAYCANLARISDDHQVAFIFFNCDVPCKRYALGRDLDLLYKERFNQMRPSLSAFASCIELDASRSAHELLSFVGEFLQNEGY